MWILQLPRPSLLFTESFTTDQPLNLSRGVITSWLGPLWKHLARTTLKTPFIVVVQSFTWERICLRRCYPVTAVCTCLLIICWLAANVVSRSLPSNGSTHYDTISTNLLKIGIQYVVVVKLEIFSWHSCGGAEENNERPRLGFELGASGIKIMLRYCFSQFVQHGDIERTFHTHGSDN
jgi:hypothetical protein